MNIITEQGKKEFIFKIAVAFEDFALKYGQYHLNESMPAGINNDYTNLGELIGLKLGWNWAEIGLKYAINLGIDIFHGL